MPRSLSVVFASVGAVIAIGFSGACDSECANQIIRDLPSPDGRRHAVIFQRDCGATTGFSTQVSVLEMGEAPKGGGNIFVADTDHGAAPAGLDGGPVVRVEWQGARALEVRYHPRARLFAPASPAREVEVHLVADSSVGTTT